MDPDETSLFHALHGARSVNQAPAAGICGYLLGGLPSSAQRCPSRVRSRDTDPAPFM